MDNIKLDEIPTKINWKINGLFTLCFKFWRNFLGGQKQSQTVKAIEWTQNLVSEHCDYCTSEVHKKELTTCAMNLKSVNSEVL